jgi:hypothetical protein
VTPTVGRTVHYVAYGTPGGEYPAGAHRAAIITEVDPGVDGQWVPKVGLCIFNPTGLFFTRGVVNDENPSKQPGTWHWPERE